MTTDKEVDVAEKELYDHATALPPVIRLERQATSDNLRGGNGNGSPSTSSPIDTDHLCDDMQRSSLRRGMSKRTVSGGSTMSRDSAYTTPTKSADKRLSRRIIDSVQRLGRDRSRSTSRASAYLPDFRPIDRSGDVEGQYEERAVMLARAGPPTPSLPKSDSLFDMGVPRLPPMRFDGELVGQEKRSVTDHLVVTPPRTVRDSSSMSQSRQSRSTSTASQTLASTTDEKSTTCEVPKDDLLQRAIVEHESGNLQLATQLFRESGQGEDGLAIGQLMYGLSLRHGWGCEKDESRAIKWLRQAAESSADREAELLMSSRTDQEGAPPVRAAVRNELVLAIYELGNCFRYGWGCDVDPQLARHYYETAANLGDADAMSETAWCYETGFGVKKDKYKTAYWYRRSEKAGNRNVGMQWIWKPKYDSDPFVDEGGSGTKKRGLNWLRKRADVKS